MEHLPYEDRLDIWCCSAWRRLQGDLTAIFPYLKRTYEKDGDRHFIKACWNRTRGERFKLKEGSF